MPWVRRLDGALQAVAGPDALELQFQLDVYGEAMDRLHRARRAGVPDDADAWSLQASVMEFLEGHWRDADEGIREVRGPRRDFTHFKVMAWVAADRAVKAVEQFDPAGRLAFTQSYGRPELEASLLMIRLVGFLPAGDPRMVGTVAAIERELCDDGLVRRDAGASLGEIDGLPGEEGAFLPCSFWLADNLLLQGRRDEGRALFDRLVGLANDVGLLAEEYDSAAGRLVGNFPQAFTHVALVNTAHNLGTGTGPARARGQEA